MALTSFKTSPCRARQIKHGTLRRDDFRHLVGGGFGGALLEVAGHREDGVTHAHLGHAVRAAAGGAGGPLDLIAHLRSLRFCHTIL